MLIIDRHLFQRPVLVTVGDRLYRLTESDDSPVTALVPPAEGSPRAAYEVRAVEIALVIHASDDGRPLSWRRLDRWQAEATVLAAWIGSA